MARTITSVAVFCGSSPGASTIYGDAAANLGRVVGEQGIKLVYGGASVGLMGILADACIRHGGEAFGVITGGLQELEVAHPGLTKLEVVDTLHERKAMMSDAADAFIMMPGGFGTLDEFFEAVTWTQLGVHQKPCGVLDVGGYFQPLRQFLDAAVDQRFLKAEYRDSVIFGDEASALIGGLAAWTPVLTSKFLDRDDA
jgi:uncharacterized protein (TIGR00730 family)